MYDDRSEHQAPRFTRPLDTLRTAAAKHGPADPAAARSLDATRTLPISEDALGRLFERLRSRLTAVALRFTRNAEAAEDVVQNAFEKALRHRDQFRGQARVSTWLHRIVANEALMWLRAERRRANRITSPGEREIEEVVDPRPGPVEDFSREEAARLLHDRIAALGPEDRDVIERCVLPERSYGEYGAERGIHPAAAKSRAFRARRRLAVLLSS